MAVADPRVACIPRLLRFLVWKVAHVHRVYDYARLVVLVL